MFKFHERVEKIKNELDSFCALVPEGESEVVKKIKDKIDDLNDYCHQIKEGSKKNEIFDTVFEYLECCCCDRDHLSRMCFDKEFNLFSLDFKVIRFPGECHISLLPKGRIKRLIYKTKHYFTNIWWAIRGRPLWYTSEAQWDCYQALKIAEFIYKQIGRASLSFHDAQRIMENVNRTLTKNEDN